MSQEAKILVKELLTMDPENRHTAEKTLRSRCCSCPQARTWLPQTSTLQFELSVPPLQCGRSPHRLSYWGGACSLSACFVSRHHAAHGQQCRQPCGLACTLASLSAAPALLNPFVVPRMLLSPVDEPGRHWWGVSRALLG